MKKSIDNINQARLLEELRIKSAAIDSAVNGIAFGDLEGRVTYANAAAIELKAIRWRRFLAGPY